MRESKQNSKLEKTQTVPWSSHGGTTIPATLLAVLALQIFRAALHPSPAWIYCELIFFTTISITLSYFVYKYWRKTRASKPKAQFDYSPRHGDNLVYVWQAGAALVFVMLIAWQLSARTFGAGDANEVVALLALQYVALYLAMVGFIPECSKASMGLSGALVFFVCCLSQRFEVACVAGAFLIFSMWGLLGMYWSQLDNKAIDGNSQRLPIRRTSMAATLLVVLIATSLSFLLPDTDAATALRGFSPFSGGEDGYESAFARDGIGDGEMLTGGDNATTTGAVDTDQFIEDHKPSIYDVISEKYDGPVYKKRKTRSAALDAKTKHLHDLKQSEMSGKTFRTMRKSGKTSDKKPANKVTDALFFVEGSAPARFATAKYQHFDGWDWTAVDTRHVPPTSPHIHPKIRMGVPFFSLARSRKSYLSGDRAHRIKIMRLDTASLPMTPFLDAWHIDFVDKADFFTMDDHGQVKYNGELIPSQTVIDVYSFVPNYHTMRDLNDLRQDVRSSSNQTYQPVSKPQNFQSPYLQLPSNLPLSKINSLVAESSASGEPGWRQVEAIVQHIKTEFTVDQNWQADATAENSVAQFLDQKGGPTYLFATTCAMALRSAGYKTRIASGFVVRKSDFDPVAKQSVVGGDNIHFWPEVCLDGRYWIPVEPTPGYPVPFSVETLWQRAVAFFFAGLRLISNNPFTSIISLALAILTFVYRVHFVTLGWLAWWHFVRVLWPGNLLRTTRGLVDTRFWAAGYARPASQTIHQWYLRVDPRLSKQFFDLWNAENYFDGHPPVNKNVVIQSSQELLKSLTAATIKSHFNQTRSTE
jgi:transglutaminase-like putative cysteine protease